METAGYLLIALGGLLIGSFLNVIIHRLPRGLSIISPPSSCPGCGRRLPAWDLIPVLSFVLLKGRCRHCSAAISWRYPAVEFTTVAVFTVLYAGAGWNPFLAKCLFLAALLIAVSFIDLEHYIIPDALNLAIAGGGTVLNLVLKDITFVQAAVGAFAVGGVLLLLGLVFPGGMGGGDIKLGAALGLVLGWPLAPAGLMLGSMAGGVVSLLLIATRLKGRKDAIPFGPFIATGAIAAMFFGERIVMWYTGVYF